MTIKELRYGYEEKIAAQKRSLCNCERGFELATVVSCVGLVLVYFFRTTTLWLGAVGNTLFVTGTLNMLILAYASCCWRDDVHALIDEYVREMTVMKRAVGPEVQK